MATLWCITSLFLLTTFQQTGTRAQDPFSCAYPPSQIVVTEDLTGTTSLGITWTVQDQCGNVNFTVSLEPQHCNSELPFDIAVYCETIEILDFQVCTSDETSGSPRVKRCVGFITTGIYSCDIVQLDPGQSYRLSVATVSAGVTTAAAQLEQNAVTVPEVPANLTVVSSLTATSSITVHWDVVGVAGQFLITVTCHHFQCVNKTTTFLWDDCPQDTTVTISELTPGAFYSIVVAAQSGDKFSADSMSVIEQTDPAPPQNAAFNLMNVTSLVIIWESAEGVYDGYNISCVSCVGQQGLPVFLTRSESRYHYDGLTRGQMYNFTIFTISGPKYSQPMETVIVIDPAPVVGIIVLFIDSRNVTLEWQPPQGIYSHFIIKVTSDSGEDMVKTTSLNATLVDLTPGTLYTFTVYTVSGNKESEGTEYGPLRTLEEPPGPVSNLRLIAMSSTILQVSWQPPQDPNGVITGYTLRVRNSGDEEWNGTVILVPSPPGTALPMTTSTPTSCSEEDIKVRCGDGSGMYPPDVAMLECDVSGLVPHNVYVVEVFAATAPGAGDGESRGQRTQQDRPCDPPTNVVVYNTSSSPDLNTKSVNVTWTPPNKPNGDVSYTVYITDSTGTTISTNTSTATSHHVVTDLTVFSTYMVKVAAYTIVGYGPESEQVVFTTEGEGTDGSTNGQSVIIGVGTAGGIIVLIIIILTAIFCLRRRQKNAGRRRNHGDDMMQAPSDGTTSRENIMSSQLIDTGVVSTAAGVVNESLEMTYAVPEDYGRLLQVKTVDDVSKFLQFHNFAEYIGAFQDHEVDGDALRCLDSATLRDLMPKAGPRAKFKDILKQQTHEKATPEPQAARLIFREIPRETLKLGKLLGRGQFGEVRLGEVRNRGVTTTVAVKTLHASASESDKKDLLGELEILVTVGRHDNVISLVGACTIGDPMCVVVEYAPNGSLKDWLKANSPEQIQKDSAYYNIEAPLSSLPMEQLVQFGIDVAAGMSHLAAMQCVHRDLAARNILLGEGLVAKVSDFGLSRDIYEDAEYVKTTSTKLPLRWMAYESLFYKVYTTQSDIWSYGILLWEIMTMGKLPYQGIKGKEMMNMIKDGYRLEKPASCPEDIYDVMTSCWQSLPGDRPSFPQLRTSLDRIVQQYKTYASLLK